MGIRRAGANPVLFDMLFGLIVEFVLYIVVWLHSENADIPVWLV